MRIDLILSYFSLLLATSVNQRPILYKPGEVVHYSWRDGWIRSLYQPAGVSIRRIFVLLQPQNRWRRSAPFVGVPVTLSPENCGVNNLLTSKETLIAQSKNKLGLGLDCANKYYRLPAGLPSDHYRLLFVFQVIDLQSREESTMLHQSPWMMVADARVEVEALPELYDLIGKDGSHKGSQMRLQLAIDLLDVAHVNRDLVLQLHRLTPLPGDTSGFLDISSMIQQNVERRSHYVQFQLMEMQQNAANLFYLGLYRPEAGKLRRLALSKPFPLFARTLEEGAACNLRPKNELHDSLSTSDMVRSYSSLRSDQSNFLVSPSPAFPLEPDSVIPLRLTANPLSSQLSAGSGKAVLYFTATNGSQECWSKEAFFASQNPSKLNSSTPLDIPPGSYHLSLCLPDLSICRALHEQPFRVAAGRLMFPLTEVPDPLLEVNTPFELNVAVRASNVVATHLELSLAVDDALPDRKNIMLPGMFPVVKTVVPLTSDAVPVKLLPYSTMRLRLTLGRGIPSKLWGQRILRLTGRLLYHGTDSRLPREYDLMYTETVALVEHDLIMPEPHPAGSLMQPFAGLPNGLVSPYPPRSTRNRDGLDLGDPFPLAPFRPILLPDELYQDLISERLTDSSQLSVQITDVEYDIHALNTAPSPSSASSTAASWTTGGSAAASWAPFSGRSTRMLSNASPSSSLFNSGYLQSLASNEVPTVTPAGSGSDASTARSQMAQSNATAPTAPFVFTSGGARRVSSYSSASSSAPESSPSSLSSATLNNNTLARNTVSTILPGARAPTSSLTGRSTFVSPASYHSRLRSLIMQLPLEVFGGEEEKEKEKDLEEAKRPGQVPSFKENI